MFTIVPVFPNWFCVPLTLPPFLPRISYSTTLAGHWASPPLIPVPVSQLTWYLLGVKNLFRPCPQNRILVLFRGPFQNFWRSPLLLLYRRNPPPPPLKHFVSHTVRTPRLSSQGPFLFLLQEIKNPSCVLWGSFFYLIFHPLFKIYLSHIYIYLKQFNIVHFTAHW